MSREPQFDDDNPEWTSEDFARATRFDGVSLAEATEVMRRKPGRPPAERPKPRVTMRLDQDLLDHYRAMGRGWQTRINEVLRKASGI
ncbi:BrnA antitoxin family protein [Sphingoaurantiacus capsulatus]|uniref:BrnA antitoxin family protein n=1 Tax=Sphingoaurantiacus capsulatus TaxID=1771310 RepID=A0ABV7X883_9SPHN